MSQQSIHPVIESVVARMGLTRRQSEITCRIAMSLGMSELSQMLSISPATVRTHLRDIFRTMKVRSRAELVSTILSEVLSIVDSQPANDADSSVSESDPQSPGRVSQMAADEPHGSEASRTLQLARTSARVETRGSFAQSWSRDQSDQENAMANTLKLLVVDDDADYLRLAVGLLERLGQVCIPASDGEEAVELYRQERPDAVLMDILMPVMDGIEATAVILVEDPTAQVVFVSVLDDFPEGTPQGIAESLQIRKKPANREQMESILRSLTPHTPVLSEQNARV